MVHETESSRPAPCSRLRARGRRCFSRNPSPFHAVARIARWKRHLSAPRSRPSFPELPRREVSQSAADTHAHRVLPRDAATSVFRSREARAVGHRPCRPPDEERLLATSHFRPAGYMDRLGIGPGGDRRTHHSDRPGLERALLAINAGRSETFSSAPHCGRGIAECRSRRHLARSLRSPRYADGADPRAPGNAFRGATRHRCTSRTLGCSLVSDPRARLERHPSRRRSQRHGHTCAPLQAVGTRSSKTKRCGHPGSSQEPVTKSSSAETAAIPHHSPPSARSTVRSTSS